MKVALVTTEESTAPRNQPILMNVCQLVSLTALPSVRLPVSFRFKLTANNGYSNKPSEARVAKKDDARFDDTMSI